MASANITIQVNREGWGVSAERVRSSDWRKDVWLIRDVASIKHGGFAGAAGSLVRQIDVLGQENFPRAFLCPVG